MSMSSYHALNSRSLAGSVFTVLTIISHCRASEESAANAWTPLNCIAAPATSAIVKGFTTGSLLPHVILDAVLEKEVGLAVVRVPGLHLVHGFLSRAGTGCDRQEI